MRLLVMLAIALTPTIGYSQTPVIAGAVNEASFAQDQPLSPGSLVALFGTGLAASTATASTVPLPDSIAGVSVTSSGITAPLQFIWCARGAGLTGHFHDTARLAPGLGPQFRWVDCGRLRVDSRGSHHAGNGREHTHNSRNGPRARDAGNYRWRGTWRASADNGRHAHGPGERLSRSRDFFRPHPNLLA
jgi:hypothetical protein